MSIKIEASKINLETWCKENGREDLIAEWDTEKNNMPMSEYGKSSHFKVWWKCSKGHSYDAVVGYRTASNQGCPYCSNRRILKGFNDLATWCKENGREDLIAEWDTEKNNNKPMSEYSRGSEYKAFWVCSKGHSFSTKIGNRTILNNGCPYCSGSKVLKGFNDLETWCRENNKEYLIKEYDTNKNNKAMSEYKPKVDYKVWWLCPKGHSYQAIIGDRTKDINATNCPVCAGKKVLEGERRSYIPYSYSLPLFVHI